MGFAATSTVSSSESFIALAIAGSAPSNQQNRSFVALRFAAIHDESAAPHPFPRQLD